MTVPAIPTGDAVIGWVTVTDLPSLWPDAPADDTLTALLLASAHEQCEEYAPALGEGEEVPLGYVLAQVAQARALYRANTTGTGDAYGAEGMTVTIFPMDWQVKNLLRPNPGGRVVIR